MLVIRFLRTGKKNQPFFRIVVTHKKNPPQGGRFLEILGFFNPLTKERKIKTERVKYWLSVGAQTSERVHNLLVSEGIIRAKKIPVHKKPKKKEESTSQPQPSREASPEPSEESTQESSTGEGESKVHPQAEKENQPQQESAPQPQEKESDAQGSS